MPDLKRMIHYCRRCNKEMKYADKSMLYTYKVEPHYYHKNSHIPKKKYAINLCDDCRIYFQKLIKKECEQQ